MPAKKKIAALVEVQLQAGAAPPARWSTSFQRGRILTGQVSTKLWANP